jgi:hypothetical protein
MANRNPNTKGLIPWKPVQSGNPSGRPRTQPISDRYAHIAEEKLPEGKAAIRVTEERESPQVDLSAIPTRHVPVRPN